MFDVTRSDIKELLRKYKKKLASESSDEYIGGYKMEYLIECGLKYIYGDQHITNGHVVDCKTSFRKDLLSHSTHKCKKDFVAVTPTKLNIPGTPICSAITGLNLAVVSEDTLYAFFKKQLLFSHIIGRPTAMLADSNQIAFGFSSGNVIFFNPGDRSQRNCIRHNKKVTSIRSFGGNVLSCSEDGTIYFTSQLKISDSPILDAIAVSSSRFIAISSDKTVIINDNGSTTTYMGHKEQIKALSYSNSIGVTTSDDGYMGILQDNPSGGFSVFDFGCTSHKQVKGKKVIGWGLSKLRSYDIATEKSSDLYSVDESILNPRVISHADVSSQIVAFSSHGNKPSSLLNLLDLRSNEVVTTEVGKSITDIKFNLNGDLLFLSTEEGATVCDLVMT